MHKVANMENPENYREQEESRERENQMDYIENRENPCTK